MMMGGFTIKRVGAFFSSKVGIGLAVFAGLTASFVFFARRRAQAPMLCPCLPIQRQRQQLPASAEAKDDDDGSDDDAESEDAGPVLEVVKERMWNYGEEEYDDNNGDGE